MTSVLFFQRSILEMNSATIVDMWSQSPAESSMEMAALQQIDDSSFSQQHVEAGGHSQGQWTRAEGQSASRQHSDGLQSQRSAGDVAEVADFMVSGAELLDRVESCTLWFLSQLRAGSIPDLQLVRRSSAVSRTLWV